MNNLSPDRHFTIYTMSKSLKKINQEIHLMNKHIEDFNELKRPLTLEKFDSECQQILKNLGYELEAAK